MADITFDEVSKVYDGNVLAVDKLSMHVDDGELMVLVGPSGCGKTTALRMVAGLEDVSSGKLSIGGEVVNDVLPRQRDVAMVFQNYALYPHLSVAQNMGFALKMRGVAKDEIATRVREAAATLQLTDYLDRRPRALSGGQRQRVAMGRAIVRNPRAFLMDEPLSNLDAQLRVEMRLEIARIQRLLDVATVYVTHDQVEAMTMGDRVAVMRGGVLQQVATPQEIYDRPANRFVAGFMGSPPMNLVDADLVANGSGAAVVIGDHRLDVPDSYAASHDLNRDQRPAVVLGVRPEDVQVVTSGNGIVGRVDRCEALGSEILVHLLVKGSSEAAAPIRLVVRVPPRDSVAAGDTIMVGIAPAHLHFFDAQSGETLRRSA